MKRDRTGKVVKVSLSAVDCDTVVFHRAFSYDPGNWAGSVSGTKFAFCSYWGNFSPVTVHMGNFSSVSELRFQPGYCSYGNFHLGYRDEQGATLQVSSRLPGWSVHMGKFLARLPKSRSQKPRSRYPG